MQIKRFEARNMTTALRMIKMELGPEAVILSARSLRKGKGFFGSMKYAGVEVTAAIDTRQTKIQSANSVTAKTGYDAMSNSQNNYDTPASKEGNRISEGYPGIKQTNQKPHAYKKK